MSRWYRPSRETMLRDVVRLVAMAIVALGVSLLMSGAWSEKPATCVDFSNQASAQRYYREHPDAAHLDRDGDGIACENNRMPRDMKPLVKEE